MANNLFPHTLFEQNFKIQADLQEPLVIIFLFFYNYQTLALLTLATQGYILQNIRIFPFSRFSWFLVFMPPEFWYSIAHVYLQECLQTFSSNFGSVYWNARISSPWTLAPFVAWLRAGPDQAPLVSLHFALVGKTELKRSVNSSFFSLSIQKLAVISHWLAMCQSLHCQPCHCEPVLAWLGALPHRPDQTVTCLPRVCGLPREGDG